MESQCNSSSPLDIEDIEDLLDLPDSEVSKAGANSNLVVPKVKKRAKKGIIIDRNQFKASHKGSHKDEPDKFMAPHKDEQDTTEKCFLPGQAKIYVKTWGCSHNVSDGEYMAGQLAEQGYTVLEDKDAADLWILNSCTVKTPAQQHFQNEVDTGLAQGKKVIVAGCVPQGKPDSEYIKGLSVIGVQQIDRVVEVVEETLKGNNVRLFGPKKVAVSNEERDNGLTTAVRKTGGASLALPKIRKNPLIEIIPINTGCLNACTYCKTKHARGQLGSYTIEEIVNRAKQAFEEGVVELWLTSEDTGAWGRDLGLTLPDLLEKLVQVIPDGCRLRLGMTNPPYILDHLEQIGNIMKSDKVYKFLHVPIQAGSDSVLNDMKREYTSDDFCRVVNVLRQRVPSITFATDIICGFPTETTEDFNETLAICRKYKFPVLYINQFYPRPGTLAAKMKRVPTRDVKQRTKQLTDLFHSYEPYRKRIGQKYQVLVTELAYDKQHYVGHNEFYEQVLVPKDESLMGKLVHVEIVETTKFSMKGELVKDKVVQSPSVKVKKAPVMETTFQGSFFYTLSMIMLMIACVVRLYHIFSVKVENKSSVQAGMNSFQE